MPPDEDQTLRRRHRRVDKPEKPRNRRQDPTGPPERHHHLDKHLENQAKSAQIPVHLNVLLRSQQFQVPPSSPPISYSTTRPPQTPTHPLPRRHLLQELHPQPGRERNPQKIPQPSQPRIEDASVGVIRKPCTTPTNPSSVPTSNTAPPSTPPYTLPSSTKSPPAREGSAGSFDSPTGSPPTTSTRKPTQSRSNTASKNSRAAT
jgi:hypothetical protein